MIIYRLAIEQYHKDLSGHGAKLYAGRWNETGIAALYCTENISLAALEILANADKNHIPPTYMLLKIDIPDNISFSSITNAKLKKNWKHEPDYTQFMGSEFIKNNNHLYLKVPSAIIDEEHNFVVNPEHPDFKKIKIKAILPFQFDKRFFLNHE